MVPGANSPREVGADTCPGAPVAGFGTLLPCLHIIVLGWAGTKRAWVWHRGVPEQQLLARWVQSVHLHPTGKCASSQPVLPNPASCRYLHVPKPSSHLLHWFYRPVHIHGGTASFGDPATCLSPLPQLRRGDLNKYQHLQNHHLLPDLEPGL